MHARLLAFHHGHRSITPTVVLSYVIGFVFACVWTMLAATYTAAAQSDPTPAYESDVVVVNEYTDHVATYMDQLVEFKLGDTVGVEAFDDVERANDALQNHTFTTEISDDIGDAYRAAVDDIREHARDITALAASLQDKRYANPNETITRFNTLLDAYDESVQSMHDAVAEFDDSYRGLTLFGLSPLVSSLIIWVGGALFALVVAASIIRAVRNRTINKRLFGTKKTDTRAKDISKKQRRTIRRIYRNLLLYEQGILRASKSAQKQAKKQGYDKNKSFAADQSAGVYRSLIYEFDALISLELKDTARASRMAAKAEEIGSTLYTDTVKQLLHSPTTHVFRGDESK